jgi:photosystem II stability/assembly factor-like uncharacterized protein
VTVAFAPSGRFGVTAGQRMLGDAGSTLAIAFVTTDGGATWRAVSLPPSLRFVADVAVVGP